MPSIISRENHDSLSTALVTHAVEKMKKRKALFAWLSLPIHGGFFYAAPLAALLFFAGCATTKNTDRVDKEVYQIIEEKSADVLGADSGFSLEPTDEPIELQTLPKLEEEDTTLGNAVHEDMGTPIVSLEKAIMLAVQQNRSYQTAKENLYLQVLALTLDRHRYTPIFSGNLQAALRGSAREVTEPSLFPETMAGIGGIISELEQLTGSQQELLRAYANLFRESGDMLGLNEPTTTLIHEQRITGGTTIGVDRLMHGGGRIAASLTTNFLRFLTGSPRESAGSVLGLAFTQPLLEGAGSAIAAERLTQSERNALYALRTFTHYRKEFTVNVCTAYYNVLKQRDVVRNTWTSLQNFMLNVERERAFAQEGLRTQAELGRMVQFQLNNENEYVNAARRYQEDLDEFKIMLGLSTETALILDNNELDTLREQGLNHPQVNLEEAIEVALVSRLDLYNQRDRVFDAERKLKVAANALKPGLDIVAGAQTASLGESTPAKFDFDRTEWYIGLDVDPPLDKKAEHNAYRSALIDLERASRESSLAQDTIKLDVRAAWRNLEQARRNYEVAQESVKLSQRRVDEQQLLSELGLSTAQDQVDAQDDLIRSQNSLTSALITHTLARLSFWRNMGILYISPEGLWKEIELPQ
ncbi:MAG: TolC family protein [Candidatus Hydrogenedentes bacterium]|nr:TolC family protein [Candidatus Hydrogenedentota bacterium]